MERENKLMKFFSMVK